MNISHNQMLTFAKNNFEKIMSIKSNGYAAAKEHTNIHRRPSQMAQSLTAACNKADLSKGAYYFDGLMCMGIVADIDRNGKYIVRYWPLFGK